MGHVLWSYVILQEHTAEAAFASGIRQTQETISAVSVRCSLFTSLDHISCT